LRAQDFTCCPVRNRRLPIFNVNRRMRNRMSGGVGGRGREAPSYPITYTFIYYYGQDDNGR
jgi:hypothetical protein